MKLATVRWIVGHAISSVIATRVWWASAVPADHTMPRHAICSVMKRFLKILQNYSDKIYISETRLVCCLFKSYRRTRVWVMYPEANIAIIKTAPTYIGGRFITTRRWSVTQSWQIRFLRKRRISTLYSTETMYKLKVPTACNMHVTGHLCHRDLYATWDRRSFRRTL